MLSLVPTWMNTFQWLPEAVNIARTKEDRML